MDRHVIDLREIGRTWLSLVGGKAAGLGELTRMDGVRVPSGFCVTTTAFDRAVAGEPSLAERIALLSSATPDDAHALRTAAEEIRGMLVSIDIPAHVRAAIIDALARLGTDTPCAVRSSATAEDLPTASFAGLQDTMLNVVGADAILEAVRRCWASLFTERAVAYRAQNRIDHTSVKMAVVVQQMLFPQVSGVMFTADPVSGNRNIVSIDAVCGLGEALVSGVVNPDVYRVRDGALISRTIGAKECAIVPAREGGTRQIALDAAQQVRPALTDHQAIRLAGLGRRIEAHFGSPQDIEWCLVGDDFHIVQSRPITTLFPIPSNSEPGDRVYLSVGHQQMMTDAMRPLGISFWQMTAGRPMYEAGGRLFVDVTGALASEAGRAGLLGMAGRSDPLVGDALRTVIERDIVPLQDHVAPPTPPPSADAPPIETDRSIVTALIERAVTSIHEAQQNIRSKSGAELFDFILSDIQEMRSLLFDPEAHRALMAGIEAAWWINDRMQEWLGESNAADTLTQSVPDNVTSEMGLALLDVADVIRPHREVVAFLERVEDDGFLDGMTTLAGGSASHAAIVGWLEKYGMRCVGEIDITRPRWSERPSALVPLILAHVRNFTSGEGARRFESGRREAMAKKRELLERLRLLPDGEAKAADTERMIDRVRTFTGYREYPKYAMISRYFVYKLALLEEADRLVEADVIADRDDIYYLTFHELNDVVRSQRANPQLIRDRREAFDYHRTLTPPRVLTSEGEAISGSHHRAGVPSGALVGLPVSTGTVEGRARVILDLADADLEPGDILVTTFTDPSWTPLFVAIRALVTEVGGLMSHGSVIAREYGLPAVVGVAHATRLIRDGQRIRVHGTEGWIELLPDDA